MLGRNPGSGAVDPAALERLKHLMGFRLVMVTTLLLAAAFVEAVSSDLAPVNPLYFLVGATYFLTVLYAVALNTLPYTLQVYGQVIGDLLIITGLVYLTGGLRTGFILLYPISVLVGSVLLHRGRGFVLGGLAALFYAAVTAAVRSGLIPAEGLSAVLVLPAKQVVYSIFVTAVVCLTVAMIGSYFSQSLRSVGERLEVASEEVADLRELNAVMVASIHSGLMTCDSAGRILYVNPFGESILGATSAALRGRSLRAVFGTPLLDAAALRVRVESEDLARLEVRFERGDGKAVQLGISVSSLATARPGEYLLAFQDLTEIKRLEGEVRTNEKLALMGEMAAYLAHEIRNPLGSISGSAQVLMTDANVSPDQRRLLGIITRESGRLSETLNRVLAQTRIPPATREPVDVGPVIAEAVTLLRNASEVGERHAVEFETDEGPHVCLANPDEVAQVFWNLARNGLEAMPQGGTLRVELRARADEIVLSVRDEGRGMGREEHSRLFQPLASGFPVGGGLGLAIVHRIVRDHRGSIQVRRLPTKGTQVEVRLPLVSVPTVA